MKLCKITLREADDGRFRVEKFSNTTQLRIGMLVSREKVDEWCGMKRVNVEVIGAVDDSQGELDLPHAGGQEIDPERIDPVTLAAKTMQDTGPGENPF